MKPARSLCILAVISICSVATCQEAAVKIYATVSNRHIEQGTGFFVTDHGQVVTVYHVVEGATKIKVVHEQLGPFTDVRVESVSPLYDTAVLQILPPVLTPFLKLVSLAPRHADDLQVQGYPLGAPNAVLPAHAARDGFVKSTRFNDEKGARLFALDIDIIYLALFIHPGMSGGPVLYHGQVIGILSGSYVEGGSIAWAIPSGYVMDPKFLTKVGLKPDQIARWDGLKLMDTSAWRTLRGMVRVNTAAAAISDQYFEQVEALAQTYDELYHQAWATRQDISQLRPYLNNVISDASLANDPSAAERYVRVPRQAVVKSLNRFSELSGSVGKSSQDVATALSRLQVWITDQSNLDNRSGRELTRKVQAIRDQHKDMLHGIEAYLNTDASAIQRSDSELSLAMSRSRGPADDARALLRYLDAWEPYVQAFASYQALTFMSTSTSVFRQIGQLLEPIVYQAGAPH